MSLKAPPENIFGKLALLFSSIPLLVLSIVGTHSIHRFEEHFERKRTGELEKKLDRIVAQTSFHYYLMKKIEILTDIIFKDGPDSPKIKEFFDRSKPAWNFDLSIYIWKDNRIVRVLPENASYTSTVEKIFEGFQFTREAFAERQRELKDPIVEMLGPGNRLELVKRWGGSVSGIPNDGAFFSTLLPDGMRVYLLMRNVPKNLERFSQIPGPLRNNAGMADSKASRWISPKGISLDDMKIAWQKSLLENASNISYAGYDWIFCRNSEGIIWCCVEPNTFETGKWLRNLVFLGYILSAVIFLLFILAAFKVQFGLKLVDALNSLSIRFKLLGLFGSITFLPLGIAVILGSISLLDRREVIFSEVSKSSLEGINRLEQSYREESDNFTELAFKIRNSPLIKSFEGDSLASYVFSLQENDELARFELRDASAKLLFSNTDPAIHGTVWVMDMFSKLTIRRHASNRLGNKKDKISAEELVGESLLSTYDPSMGLLLRFPGRVWTLEMGSSPVLWFWDVYPDQASGPAFICIIHQLSWIMHKQMSKALKNNKLGDVPMQAVHDLCGYKGRLQFFPPIEGSDSEALLAAATRCHVTSRILFREFDMDGKRYWATLKFYRYPTDLIYLEITPVAGKLEILRPIILRHGFTFFCALLVSLLSAATLSHLFIVPILDISKGIEAIQNRDEKHRIPIHRQDEFGSVIRAFNSLFTEFKELQYGRVVQESLLPSDPPVPPGYELVCFRQPATDLAGDYHDVIKLEDGNWVIILGDVTGHGISAALAMAMAKGTVDYHHIGKWAFPGQVMERLNALFFRELKPQRKYMTLACMLLDPKSHKIVFENAAHNFPLHFKSRAKSVEELVVPHLPLGMKKGWTPSVCETHLATGDAILLYTDGFTECMNFQEQEFGEDRLKELFARLMSQGLSLDEVIKNLIRNLDEFRIPGPYPDDVTLVLLKRVV